MNRTSNRTAADQSDPTTTSAIASDAEPRITHAMEDYLKGIYRLAANGSAVTTQRLAEELAISGPSVTNMVKRLAEMRLVEHTPYHGVRLTPAGERIALEVLRHHRLLELYLTEALGYSWDEVHAEADRLEHHVSEELEARMASVLGHPTHDPHGDPIPSPDGAIDPVSATRLLDLGPGQVGVVVRVSDRDPELLRFVAELGLRPGATVTVVEALPFEGPLRIAIDGAEHFVGRPLAAAVNVVARG